MSKRYCRYLNIKKINHEYIYCMETVICNSGTLTIPESRFQADLDQNNGFNTDVFYEFMSSIQNVSFDKPKVETLLLFYDKV